MFVDVPWGGVATRLHILTWQSGQAVEKMALRSNLITYNAALHSVSKDLPWQGVLRFLHGMRATSVQEDAASWEAAWHAGM